MINRFEKWYRKIRNLDVVKTLEKNNATLTSKLEEISQKEDIHKKFMRAYLHEIKTPLGQTLQIYGLLSKNPDNPEIIKKFSGYGEPITKKMIGLTKLLGLVSQKQTELYAQSKMINSKAILKNEIDSNQEYLQKNEVNIDSCNSEDIYFHEEIFNFIDSTLTGNALGWTEKGETITKQIKNNKNNSTYTIENPIAKNPTEYEHGFKQGFGLKFTQELIQEYGGKMETYTAYNIKTKKETFGVEITIPSKKTIESKL